MQGIYPDMSFEDYLKDPCSVPSLTRSVIRQLLDCPKKAWFNHPRLNTVYEPDKPETKFDIGKAAHSLLLEGMDIAVALEYKDWRTKEAQTARQLAAKDGKIAMLMHLYIEACEMVAQARLALIVAGIFLDDGKAEQTYIWKEGETFLRIRPDWISDETRLILDYKTTGQSAYPESFNSSVINFGLDIQESLYRRGVKAITGQDYDFIFMVQEVAPPYLCSFVRLDIMYQDMGKEKIDKGIKIWHKCLSENKWPGYPQEIYTLEPKPWSLAQWEMIKHQEAV